MSTEDLEKRLVSALVGLSGTERLYLQDAAYHAQVDLLVRLLPSWLKGLAEVAQSDQAARQRLMEEMVASPSQPLYTRPGDTPQRLLADLGLDPTD